jgi:hypothetical protein
LPSFISQIASRIIADPVMSLAKGARIATEPYGVRTISLSNAWRKPPLRSRPQSRIEVLFLFGFARSLCASAASMPFAWRLPRMIKTNSIHGPLGEIERVPAAAHRAGTLIDDLLHLSRATLSEMRTERVNLSEIARSVAPNSAQNDNREK